MKINLTRPLAFIDLETTGTNIATDRIVEMAMLIIKPDQSRESHVWRMNPEIPISAEATRVNGITNDDVKDCKKFSELAEEISSRLRECDLAGYNSNKFDVPVLMEEFARAKVAFNIDGRKLIDVQNIFHKMEKRTLSAAYKFYCDKDLTNAHAAAADTSATFEVLEAQLDRYPDLKNEIDFLAEFSTMNKNVDLGGRIIMNEQAIEVFNFGKHKGRPVAEVFFKLDPSYFDWMMKGDFSTDTKNVITRLKERGKK